MLVCIIDLLICFLDVPGGDGTQLGGLRAVGHFMLCMIVFFLFSMVGFFAALYSNKKNGSNWLNSFLFFFHLAGGMLSFFGFLFLFGGG